MDTKDPTVSGVGPDKNLKLVVEVLNSLSIQYWVNNGTLLGLVRSGQLIPWDSDVDLGVDVSQPFPFEVVEALIKMGFDVAWSSKPGSGAPALKASRFGGLPVDIAPHYQRRINGKNMLCRDWTGAGSRAVQHKTGRTSLGSAVASRISRWRRRVVYGPSPTEQPSNMGVFHRKIELSALDHCLRRWGVGHHMPNELVFPLQQAHFNGLGDLSLPANSHAYLRLMYGDDWETEKKTQIWDAFLSAPPLGARNFLRVMMRNPTE